MEKLQNLHDLLVHELSDLYSAEQQIIEALPKLIDAASSPRLVKAFSEHLEETHGHVDTLDSVFLALGAEPSGETCAAMKGIIAEGNKFLKGRDNIDPAVLDAALISAAQRVEHYEIAGYGCARTFCEHLGHSECVALLEDVLDEELATDVILSELAVQEINVQAAHQAGAEAF